MSLDVYAGPALKRRLGEHARSIQQASNLTLSDFRTRYLVVDDIWIALAESLLITQFQPLWNVIIDGFGNHDPGRGRRNQARSDRDVLHPGRPWTEKLASGNSTAEELRARIDAFLDVVDAKQENVLIPAEGD